MKEKSYKVTQEFADREIQLERVRDVVKLSNEIAQLKKIEEHFVRERNVQGSPEIDDVIGSARESVRKHEARIAALLQRGK